jgi:molybdenum cofactor biosynthesis enzyme MoaA
MKLEDIGFYTLSDARAFNSSYNSDLMRCELILTDRCNFKCVYCRGLKENLKGDMSLKRDLFTNGQTFLRIEEKI